jgi:hypothetical protein
MCKPNQAFALPPSETFPTCKSWCPAEKAVPPTETGLVLDLTKTNETEYVVMIFTQFSYLKTFFHATRQKSYRRMSIKPEKRLLANLYSPKSTLTWNNGHFQHMPCYLTSHLTQTLNCFISASTGSTSSSTTAAPTRRWAWTRATALPSRSSALCPSPRAGMRRPTRTKHGRPVSREPPPSNHVSRRFTD